MSKLNKESSVALYQQLIDEIKDQIASGKLTTGDRLMTEFELSQEYNVSRITVRKAIEVLVEENILIKKQGIGTFVAEKKLTRNVGVFMGFTSNCIQDGKTPSTKLLAAELVKATTVDVKNLDLKPGEKVIKINRLRISDGDPVVIEETRFSQKYAFLLGENLEGSLYEILAHNGIIMSGGKRTINICNTTKEEAELLEVEENEVMLYMKDICVDANGTPIHSCKSIINPRRYEIIINTMPNKG